MDGSRLTAIGSNVPIEWILAQLCPDEESRPSRLSAMQYPQRVPVLFQLCLSATGAFRAFIELQDGRTVKRAVRALANWSGAIAGLLLIITGGLVQAAWPGVAATGLQLIPLPITLQVPTLATSWLFTAAISCSSISSARNLPQ